MSPHLYFLFFISFTLSLYDDELLLRNKIKQFLMINKTRSNGINFVNKYFIV